MEFDNCSFSDSYDHPDPNIEYLPESSRCSELEKTRHYEFDGCTCTSNCSPEFCLCLQRSGAEYLFENKHIFHSYSLKEKDSKPIYECNNNCRCAGKLCGNRLVQFGPRKFLEIIKDMKKGLSLITTKKIYAGNFICEYAGKIITPDMAKNLYPLYKAKYSMNYIFCINEHFGDKTYKTLIDPTECGNIGRYINHSCDPNSKLYAIRIYDEVPKLCVFAKEDIHKGEEICFDYGTSMLLGSKTGFENKVICLCGKNNCKEYLPFDENCFD